MALRNTKRANKVAKKRLKEGFWQKCSKNLQEEITRAEKAGIPIVFAALDFKKKEIKLGEQFIPTGDVDADMMQIKAYFKDVNAKFPEKFAI